MGDWPTRLIASGHVASDGTLSRPLGIDSVVRDGVGEYTVTLVSAPTAPEGTLHVEVSPIGGADIAWRWIQVLPPETFSVSLAQAADGAAVDSDFSLRVYSDA